MHRSPRGIWPASEAGARALAHTKVPCVCEESSLGRVCVFSARVLATRGLMRGEKTADRRNAWECCTHQSSGRLWFAMPSGWCSSCPPCWHGLGTLRNLTPSLSQKKVHASVCLFGLTAFLRWPSKPSHRERGTKKPGEHKCARSVYPVPLHRQPSVTGWPFARSPAPFRHAPQQ